MKETGKFLYLDPIPSREHEGGASDTPAVPSAEEMLETLITRMTEEGYAPATQLAGFFMTEDPTYLPDDPEIRAEVRRVGRDKLLSTLIEAYLVDHGTEDA